MDLLIFLAVAVAAILALGVTAHGSARRGHRSSGSFGGLMGSVDEVFAPSRHEAILEFDRQSALPAPAPVPGDRGILDGRRIAIRLDGERA